VLTPERPAPGADGADVTMFTVSALDAQGRPVPTASNPVEFEIKGGRILGVGNGDPGCHEPDQYHEDIALLTVHDWRGRIAPAGTTAPAAPESLGTLPQLGRWKATLPVTGEIYDLTAVFTLDVVPAGADLQLYLPALGQKTTVWVNGRELARDLDTSVTVPALRLEPAQLVAGVNRVQLLVTPIVDGRNHIPELTRLGVLRVATPAPAVRRSLFSGLAQVIVQADTKAEEIRLAARAEGLSPTESTVVLRAATVHPGGP
jgi:beta-galactosidase